MKKIFFEKTEAEIVEELKKMSQNIKNVQAIIDKFPDGQEKLQLQKDLNERIKELSKKEQKSAPKPSAVAVPPQDNQQAPAEQPQAQQQQKMTIPPPQEEAPTPSAVVTPPQAATDEEAKLMKRLHGSFDPKSKTDLGKLEQMRAARQEVGDKADLKTLSKAVYAKQYAKQPEATTQTSAQQTAPTQQQNVNVSKMQSPSLNAVQQMNAPQTPFKMQQAGQNTGQGPTQQAATKPQAPVQQQTATTKEEIPTPFVRDMRKLGNVLKKSAQNIYGGLNNTKPEEGEENEEGSKKFQYFGLNKTTVQEKNNISKFLRHVSEKNYSSAHKYLKAIVESKIKRNILQRIGKI